MSEGEVSQLPRKAMISETLHDKLHIATKMQQAEEEQVLHVVMVPYPLQGHINPMMQFAKALIANHSNIRVSFINIKHHHDHIQKTRLRQASSPSLASATASSPSVKISIERSEEKLQLLWVDNGLPDDFDYTDLTPRINEFHTATLNMKNPLKELLVSLNQQSPAISCVMFGSFCHWLHELSAELGIPSVFFWTQSTSVLSIYYHAPLLADNGFFPYKKHTASGCDDDDKVGMSPETSQLVSYIPGVPPLHPSNIPSLLHVDGISNPIYISLREQFTTLLKCQGLIVNSFEELEMDAYQALRQELPFPVSLVGPLIPSAFLVDGDANDTSVGASLIEEKVECIEWLNGQRKQSVLYVSFGSFFNIPAEDLASIANGIKDSKQPFLWVIRPRSSVRDVADILPQGFMEATKEHGLIISWAPQMQVLSHPSVGAFLTHCGWNSTLECVSAGVPMIPCPLISDQATNSTYVCELWKIGMALKRHDDGSLRSSDVERVVRTVLEEKEGEEMKKKAILLQDAARRAARASGSSFFHMEEFIQTMRGHHHLHEQENALQC